MEVELRQEIGHAAELQRTTRLVFILNHMPVIEQIDRRFEECEMQLMKLPIDLDAADIDGGLLQEAVSRACAGLSRRILLRPEGRPLVPRVIKICRASVPGKGKSP